MITLLFLLSLLPLKVHYILSNVLYFLLYKVGRYRVSTVYTNLSRSFPEMKYAEVKRTADSYYHFLCDLIVETVWSITSTRKSISSHLSFAGNDVMMDAYKKGRGVMVVLGHQGNWELFTGLADLKSYYGIDIPNDKYIYVYKTPSNKFAAKIITAIRTIHHSCNIVDIEHIVRYMIRESSHNNAYFFIADQSPSDGGHFKLDFLHQTTYMITGPETLARKLKMPVVYYSIKLLKKGQYLATCQKICDDASECEEGFVISEYARLLEQSIVSQKHTWLWSHRRWKKK